MFVLLSAELSNDWFLNCHICNIWFIGWHIAIFCVFAKVYEKMRVHRQKRINWTWNEPISSIIEWIALYWFKNATRKLKYEFLMTNNWPNTLKLTSHEGINCNLPTKATITSTIVIAIEQQQKKWTRNAINHIHSHYHHRIQQWELRNDFSLSFWLQFSSFFYERTFNKRFCMVFLHVDKCCLYGAS